MLPSVQTSQVPEDESREFAAVDASGVESERVGLEVEAAACCVALLRRVQKEERENESLERGEGARGKGGRC